MSEDIEMKRLTYGENMEKGMYVEDECEQRVYGASLMDAFEEYFKKYGM